MNSFAELFKSYCLSPKLEKVYFKYISRPKSIKYTLFVEGYLDQKFYQNIFFNKLNCNYKGDLYAYICDGKAGVIEIINYLYNKSMISRNTKNIINIVDKDFDSLENHECEIKDKISLTKYYSLESYAFIETNMEIILDYLNLSNEQKKIYYDNFKIYLNLLLDYEALLKCSVNENIAYISTDILNNASLMLNSNITIEGDFQSVVIRKVSHLSKNVLKKFLSAKNLMEKNYLNYRGHDLEKYFNFMMEYFKLDVKLSEILSLDEITKKINVDLDIK